VHQSQRRVAIIAVNRRQRLERIGAEALFGWLAGFAVDTAVSHLVEPLSDLAVDVGQIGELAQGPEVLADLAHAAFFHFAFGEGRQPHPVLMVYSYVSG
jgi:hypothetical protein